MVVGLDGELLHNPHNAGSVISCVKMVTNALLSSCCTGLAT